MNLSEHIKQAEKLLSESEQDMATAQSQREWRQVQLMVQMAQAHAQIASAQRWADRS